MIEGKRPIVRLKVLGGFRLECGADVVSLPYQSRRLLGLLALCETVVPRPTLAGKLWSEYTQQAAHSRLRTAVWRIRQVADWALLCHDDSLSVSPDVDVDLWSVRAQTCSPAHADHQPIGTEIDILCQDLLPDWDEEWLVTDRERLRQDRLHTLERLGGELSRRGRHQEAIASTLAAVAIEPLRESAQIAVVEAHLNEGNVSEALRQYHGYRELVKAELGIDPGHRIVSLVQPYLKT